MNNLTTYLAELELQHQVLSAWQSRGERLASEARMAAADRSSAGMLRADNLLHAMDKPIEIGSRIFFVRFKHPRPEVVESCEIKVKCYDNHDHFGSGRCFYDADSETWMRYWIPDPNDLDEMIWEAEDIARAEAYRASFAAAYNREQKGSPA